MLNKIKKNLSEQLLVDEDSIDENTSFRDDLNADSLDLFEMIMALEEEYDIQIAENDLNNINTVGDLIEYLNSRGIEA